MWCAAALRCSAHRMSLLQKLCSEIAVSQSDVRAITVYVGVFIRNVSRIVINIRVINTRSYYYPALQRSTVITGSRVYLYTAM